MRDSKIGLVLKRNVGEQIVINDGEIVITLVDIRGDHSARIGIKAPPHVAVHRFEVHERLQRERAAGVRA